jgi:hypothetical protein
MIGSGVKSYARGMASGATIVARKSNYDESELADFASKGGILSNHSYSSGDPDGYVPEYGMYTYNSSEWDEIMYNAPYLTICKSAGNNRNDDVNVDDKGYDLIFTLAACKNLITIGAVEDLFYYQDASSVVQSAFSNWGPTDDWRIKPDITANGVGLYSANNITNASYISKSGTSMSSPSVCGSIALLQQHFHNMNQVYMKSATVKALLFCTTDEAGEHDGPDFQSGWGLMNTARAAELISEKDKTALIEELSLNNGEVFTKDVAVDGSSPIAITINWTDPVGDLTFGEDNQTPVLVNDLDLRLMANGFVYEPWTFTPNESSTNFTDAASHGDNFRDNTERIDIKDIPAGIYTIKISHKGSLVEGHQDFSLVASGLSETNVTATNQLIKNCSAIKMFPTPLTTGYLFIHFPDEFKTENTSLFIFDVSGRLIKNIFLQANQNQVDLSDLKPGFYIAKIRQNKSALLSREIIVK